MEFTEEQIVFLDKVYPDRHRWLRWYVDDGVILRGSLYAKGMNLMEIPIKFKEIRGSVDIRDNKLTSLESLNVTNIGWGKKIYLSGNNLGEYFKNVKRKDFKHWNKLDWYDIIQEYPFMINRAKPFVDKYKFEYLINKYPLTKIYLK